MSDGEPTKDDLLEEAKDLGVTGVSRSTPKEEVKEAVEEARNAPSALGPVVDENGETAAFEQKGSPNKGIAPKDDDDLRKLGEIE